MWASTARVNQQPPMHLLAILSTGWAAFFLLAPDGVHCSPFLFAVDHCILFYFLVLDYFSPWPNLTHSYPIHLPTFVSTTSTLVPYLLFPSDIATLITSYPIDLITILITYPTNLATLLITYHTNLTTVLTTYPTDIATLITSYPIDLVTILITYPTNLATLLITYHTNLTIVLTTYSTDIATLHTQSPYWHEYFTNLITLIR